jgi:hypothetical protein
VLEQIGARNAADAEAKSKDRGQESTSGQADPILGVDMRKQSRKNQAVHRVHDVGDRDEGQGSNGHGEG